MMYLSQIRVRSLALHAHIVSIQVVGGHLQVNNLLQCQHHVGRPPHQVISRQNVIFNFRVVFSLFLSSLIIKLIFVLQSSQPRLTSGWYEVAVQTESVAVTDWSSVCLTFVAENPSPADVDGAWLDGLLDKHHGRRFRAFLCVFLY